MRTCLLFVFLFLSLISSAQWVVVTSSTNKDLKEITFTHADTGFICGHGGAFLASYNSGSDWAIIPAGYSDFDYIEAIDRNKIFLAGPDGLYRTFNGGGMWEHLMEGKALYDLAYNHTGNLFIKQISLSTCESSQGQVTWQNYHAYSSTDFGSSFSYCNTHQVLAGQIQFLDNNYGYDISGYRWYGDMHCESNDLGRAAYTSDGGTTWQESTHSFFYGPLGAASFINASLGYIQQNFPISMLLRTNDGTQSFSFIPLVNLAKFTDMVFINEYIGYALINNIIYKLDYLDGNIAWQIDFIAGNKLNNITLSPSFKAFVVGEDGTILSKQLYPDSGPDTLFLIKSDKTALQFDNTTIGASHIEELHVFSHGNMPVTVKMGSDEPFRIKLAAGDSFSDTIPEFILQPSQDTIIQVQFTPEDLIDYTGCLRIHTNALSDTVISVLLSGKGILELSGVISGDKLICGQNISIVGDVIVEAAAKVTICPGTTVNFTGPYSFSVHGSLDARGVPDNRIVFTSPEETSGWQGIRIFGSDNTDTTILSYCLIENGEYHDWAGGLYGSGLTVTDHERIIIQHCEIRNNYNHYNSSALKVIGSKVYIGDNIIHHNTSDNLGETVEITSSTGLMENNVIYSNDGLAIVFHHVENDFTLMQNLIFNNNGSNEVNNTSAISVRNSSPDIILNTICNNYSDEQRCALLIYQGSDPLIEGNQIFGNEYSQVCVSNFYPASNPVIRYNNIEGGWENGGFNMNADPGFISPSPKKMAVDNFLDYDFRFTANSSCFNKYSNPGAYIPQLDLDGLPRIYGGVLDIGAYEAHFQEQLGPITACTGDTILLTVIPISPPPHQFTWTLNGVLLSSVTGNQLELENIKEEDEGIYECRVLTGSDTLTTSGKLSLLSEPVLISPPVDISCCVGDTLFATAWAEGENLDYEWINLASGQTEAMSDTFYFNTQSSFSGRYKCRISNKCNLIETTPFTVDVWPEYVVALGNDTTLRKSASLILDAGEGARSYLWDTGDTTRFYTVIGENHDPGLHKFHVTVEYAPDYCTAEGFIWVEIIDDSSINENENDFVNIFPNPSNGVLFCSFDLNLKEKEASYYLEDMSGRLLYRGEISISENGKATLPYTDLSQGIYFIRFVVNGSAVSSKVIILGK